MFIQFLAHRPALSEKSQRVSYAPAGRPSSARAFWENSIFTGECSLGAPSRAGARAAGRKLGANLWRNGGRLFPACAASRPMPAVRAPARYRAAELAAGQAGGGR